MDFYLSFLVENWWRFLIVIIAAYLLGSINTAVVVTKIATKGKQDIRELGSGNAGFTNVLRSVGKTPAIITIICDALKCNIAVLFGGFVFSFIAADSQILSNEFVNFGKYAAGIFCILGHSYPIYFKFRGGKGVVSAAALMATEDWRVFLLIISTFLIIFFATKIISLASITCAALYSVYTFLMTFFFDYMQYGYSIVYVIMSTSAALIIGVFVIIKHKSNIGRLLRGEEKKISIKKN